MDEKEEDGEKRGERRREQHELSAQAWSMQTTPCILTIPGLTPVQNVQRMRLEREQGAGLECHFEEHGDSELLKGFRTGNGMIRCEM